MPLVKDKDKKNTEEAKQVSSLKIEISEVDENYVPEGFDTVEEFLKDLREEYQLDIDFDDENRKNAIEDKKFAAGEQWDPIVLEQRKGLPCLVINSVPQFIAQLVGDWRESKKGIKVVPTEDGDTDIASIRGDLIRAIELQSRADRVYTNAFQSEVECGDGAFRISVEYAKDDVFDQDIFIRPIEDAISVVWDRMSIDPTGRDARHVFVDDIMSRKEFRKIWGDTEVAYLGKNERTDLQEHGWINDDQVRVTEYWRLIERPRLLGQFENGSVRFIDNENIEELMDKNGPLLRTRVAPCSYAQMHLVTGFKILSGPYEYKLNRVPVIRMTGNVVNVQGRRIRSGLVRAMKDPVRLKNFWRSVAAEQLGYSPKAQWLAPASAVEGKEQRFREAHLSRDPLLIYNDDASVPPQRIDPIAPQAALLTEAQQNTQDMKDVTGIHDASLGIRSNEVSGRAITARQREGDIASLAYFDNANAAILEGGDVINQLISQVYDGTRIIRIVGEDEKVKFLKVNDPTDNEGIDLSVGKYDVGFTTGTSYSTRRVEAAQAMMDAIQVWPQLIQIAGDVVAKAQDWPGADKLAERLKKTIPPQFLDEEERQESNIPYIDPAEFEQLQTQLQQLAQENQLLKQEKEIDAYNAETKRIDVLGNQNIANSELGFKAISEAINSADISKPEPVGSNVTPRQTQPQL